jgi:hypothetical protein
MGGEALIVQGVRTSLTPGGEFITDANIAVIAGDLADAFVNSQDRLQAGVAQFTQLIYPEAPDYVARVGWVTGSDYPDSLVPSFDPFIDRAELVLMFEAALTRARTVGDSVTWGLQEARLGTTLVGGKVISFVLGYFRRTGRRPT